MIPWEVSKKAAILLVFQVFFTSSLMLCIGDIRIYHDNAAE